MGIFSRRKAPPDLDERLEALERGLKAIRAEWEDTYERVVRMMGRMAKRAALDKAREDAPETTIGEGAGGDELSRRIRALRRPGGA